MHKTISIGASIVGLLCLVGSVSAQPVQWKVAAGGNGHYYEAIHAPNGLSWTEADNTATAQGKHLATIHSTAENNFVYALVDDPQFWFIDTVNNALGPWLGGFQDPGATEVDGGWIWVTGEPWSYVNWNPGTPEPNDSGDYIEDHAEDYLHFFGSGPMRQAFWNDLPAEIPILGYVVEWIPEPASALLLVMAAVGLLATTRSNRQ